MLPTVKKETQDARSPWLASSYTTHALGARSRRLASSGRHVVHHSARSSSSSSSGWSRSESSRLVQFGKLEAASGTRAQLGMMQSMLLPQAWLAVVACAAAPRPSPPPCGWFASSERWPHVLCRASPGLGGSREQTTELACFYRPRSATFPREGVCPSAATRRRCFSPGSPFPTRGWTPSSPASLALASK